MTATQDAARITGDEAWGIVSRLIGGMLVYGALGWLIGRWLDHTTAGLTIGVLLGLAFGMYLSILRVHRIGSDAPPLEISGTGSWSARMTRARIDREVSDES